MNSYAAKADIGVTYTAERSVQTFSGQNFWKQGGTISIGTSLWRGLGPAFEGSVTHASKIGSGNIGITATLITLGPRYRFHESKKVSPYAEFLFGLAHGSGSVFPATNGAKDVSDTFALVGAAGVDYRVTHHLDIRALEIGWTHSSFPNGADDKQNNFRISSGLVYRFGK